MGEANWSMCNQVPSGQPEICCAFFLPFFSSCYYKWPVDSFHSRTSNLWVGFCAFSSQMPSRSMLNLLPNLVWKKLLKNIFQHPIITRHLVYYSAVKEEIYCGRQNSKVTPRFHVLMYTPCKIPFPWVWVKLLSMIGITTIITVLYMAEVILQMYLRSLISWL